MNKFIPKHIKNALFFILVGAFSFSLNAQNVGINTTGAAPVASAILDLNTGNAGNVGFLAPQASLVSNTDVATIPAPATGLLVYNTNAAMVGGSGVGYYYWNGATWISGVGAGNFIFNQTTVQAGANFNIAQNGVIGGTLNVTGLSTLGAITTVGVASINGSGANTTTIGNGTNALSEFGIVTINNNNGAATTGIGTGSTTGNVSIGGASNNVLLPKYTTDNEVLYTSGGNGTITATPASTAAKQVLMTTLAGGAPTFQSLGALNGITVITHGTVTYSPAAGTSVIQVELIGGGGGGGSSSAPATNGSSGGGGGAGGYVKFFINNPVGPYAVSVGLGGAGAPAGGNGSAGAATTFAGGYSAGGGAGGGKGTANIPGAGGAGGNAVGGLINVSGAPGAAGPIGGSSGDVSGAGGSSVLGGGGAPVNETTSAASLIGNAGSANSGSGGSGCATFGSASPVAGGGAGANGIIIITEYK